MKCSVKTLFTVAIFLFCGLSSLTMASLVGGISDKEKNSSDEVQGMLASLNTEIKSSALELLAGSNGGSGDQNDEQLAKFRTANITEMGYKTQIVAGVNYFVRAKIDNFIFHVRIYRDLQKHVSLTKVIGPKEASDPIQYF